MPSRRSFVKQSFGIAVLGGALPEIFARAASAQPLVGAGEADPGNVLVVVQLGGGNDGLNTVIPFTDDGYHRVRPAIGIAEKAALPIDDRIALNPVMAPMLELYKEGKLAIVQGVGYPNPNRSHFESTQIWETGSPDRPATYGWLGRYLDRTEPPAQANAAAAGTAPSFRAVSLLDIVPTALTSQRVDVPAVGSINTFAYANATTKTAAGVLYDGARPGQSPYLTLVEDTARNALHGGDILRAKTASYKPAVTYPTDAFSNQLAQAARIIGSNIGTRIVFVSIGSFDTHAGQRAQQDRLLGYLANGLHAFYADLEAHGFAQNVLVMSFSEFGRRVSQNASNGTDHGTAAPMFVLGGKVRGGVYGEHPSLTDLDHGDLKFAIDFRSVYSTVLANWLGRNPADVIAGEFTPLRFV